MFGLQFRKELQATSGKGIHIMADDQARQKTPARAVAEDVYTIMFSALTAGLHIEGIVDKMEIERIKSRIETRINSFQITSVALDRIEQDDAITSFLLDMGAKVEMDEYFHISLQGTQEKAAPTGKFDEE